MREFLLLLELNYSLAKAAFFSEERLAAFEYECLLLQWLRSLPLQRFVEWKLDKFASFGILNGRFYAWKSVELVRNRQFFCWSCSGFRQSASCG